MTETPQPARRPSPLDILLELIRRARSAENEVVLGFIAVNDSHLLAPYQQAALWSRERGVEALSGLTEVEANAPYAQWLARVFDALAGSPARSISASDLPGELAAEGTQWLPASVLWVPFGPTGDHALAGGLLFARELPWHAVEQRLFVEWIETWFCARRALHRPSVFAVLRQWVRRAPRALKRKPLLWAAASLAVLLCPVRLSVLAPGELVPAHPLVIRAPLDGVIKAFLVQTNEPVKAGQALFTYDDISLASKLGIATEALRTAEIEERQYSQQALTDMRARGALAAAKGQVEEKRLDADYLREQLARNTVIAPGDGVAFIDDPSEWVGRPVVAGERIMRLAEVADIEIEAWLPVADAIVLPAGASARLYLAASPLEPVAGSVRAVSFDAIRQPDGSYAYRVRATLERPTAHRVGLKGTVRLSGRRVPFVYWAFRRPVAALREFFGW